MQWVIENKQIVIVYNITSNEWWLTKEVIKKN